MKLSAISKVVISSLLVATSVGVANADKHRANYKDQAVFKDQAPCATLPMLRDGFYLGAQAGYDAYRVRQSMSGASFNATNINNITGWVGGLFVGYGQFINNFYLGGEVLGNYNGSNPNVFTTGDNDGDSFTQKMQVKGTWGVSILPGVKIADNVLGFLRLGYDWTKFNSKFTAVDAGGPSTSGSTNKTIGGWDAGLGLETVLVDNWSLRTEYNHIWYNSTSIVGGPFSDNANISDNQFMLGVVYHVA